jgi:hypothetical protein
MVLSSSILFVAGNLQTLSTIASCSNDSLLMIARSLPAFAKQFGGDLEQALVEQFNSTSQSAVWNFAASFLGATGDSL